jgi:hypothetical protein
LKKLGGLLENKYEKDMASHYLGVYLGENPEKTRFNIKFLAGGEAT